jgi:hypothetical protein
MGAVGFVEAARFLGGQFFTASRIQSGALPELLLSSYHLTERV